MSTTKLTLLEVSKDKWVTKEETGQSLKNALYAYCSMPKSTFQAELI